MQEILLYLFGVLILILGLALSIGLHEIGHLLPAKLFRVKVLQYMIGFGPTIWSRKKGETEYGVKLIPLGGYVSMIGMYPPQTGSTKKSRLFGQVIDDARAASSETVLAGEDHRAFYALPTLKKIVIMLGGPVMNLLLAVIFMAVVVSGFGVAQATTKVDIVSECLLPADTLSTECTADAVIAPAAAGGMLPGDEIIAINGTDINSWDEIPQIVSLSPGKSLEFKILRSGIEQTVNITPAANLKYVFDDLGRIQNDELGEPVTQEVGMIGITPTIESVRLPVTAAPGFVFDNIKAVANIILHMPERLVAVWHAAFGPDERELDGPLSVVGVGRLAGEIASNDETPFAAKAQTMFGLLASLNVALFVFNLVPLLPLDGGHILGAIYEGAKRRLWRILGKPDPGPVDTAKMVPVTLAVAVVFIAMTLLLVYADLVKPISLFN